MAGSVDASAGALGVDEAEVDGAAVVDGLGSAAVLQPLRMSAVARPRMMARDFKMVPPEDRVGSSITYFVSLSDAEVELVVYP